MAKLSDKEEKRLLGAIERSIELSNKGMSPNDAIEKVALEEQYAPPFIKRMCTAFNKSKSVSTFTKEANASRRKEEFPLADATQIISKIYGAEKEASVKEVLKFPTNIRELPVMQKAAAKAFDALQEYRGLSPSAMMTRIDKCRSAHSLLKKQLHDKEASARQEFEDCLLKVAFHVQSMPENALQKMAQLVMNGYPEFGKKMLSVISQKAQRDIPMVEKQAEAAVFPPREPYFSIAKAQVYADAYLQAHQDNLGFSKYAEDIIGGVLDDLAGTVSDVTGFLGDKDKKKDVAKASSIETDLDPEFFNALKEVDTRTNFANLALYDKELSQYDMPTLIGAFNASTALVPEAINSPPTLKALMLQNINTGGMQDLFQVEQAGKISKNLRERTEKVKKQLDEAKSKVKESTQDAKEWWQDRQSSPKEEGIISKMLSAAGEGGDKKDDKKTDEVKGLRGDTKKLSKLVDRHLTIADPRGRLTKEQVDVTRVASEAAKRSNEAVSPADVYSAVEKEITGDKLSAGEAAALEIVKNTRRWQ